MKRPALQLERIVKTYPGEVRALDGVTLSVAEGERCCLLGPNGAGKTTIMRLLQGAIRPDSGRIDVLGSSIEPGGLLASKRRMGIVPQNPGLYGDLTVLEYLRFVRSLYARGAPEDTAAAYGLDGYLSRPLASLSGGLQRRLLVAAAVLSEPSLLLLDEPTVGLDPLAAAETRRMLGTAMQDRTVLMSTHNLAEAEELCDTVIIIRRGTVLIHERIEDLRRQTRPRVHLTARQGIPEVTASLRDLDVDCSPNEHGVWLQVDEPRSDLPGLLRTLLARGIDVYECRVVPPTLEDLFAEVVTQT